MMVVSPTHFLLSAGMYIFLNCIVSTCIALIFKMFNCNQNPENFTFLSNCQ